MQPAQSGSTRRVAACFIATCLATALAADAQAAIFRVGPATDPACDFTRIQDALDTAAANGEDDRVRVSLDLYTEQALVIEGHGERSLELLGGFANCSTETPTGFRTTLDGHGGAPASVIRIANSRNIAIESFEITRGDPVAPDEGGGITHRSTGTLWLEDLEIHHNGARHGGGLHLAPDTGTALVLGRDLVIRHNVAGEDGGGIHAVAADVQLRELELRGNTAGRCGGGAHLVGGSERSARASAISGKITLNRAASGGGLCVDAGAQLRLYNATDGEITRLAYNEAEDLGGALLIRSTPQAGVPPTRVRSNDAWFNRNSARRGAVVAIDTPATGGSGVFCAEAHDLFADACVLLPLHPEHRGCPEYSPCGFVTGNAARAANGLPAGASLVHARGGEATFYFTGFRALDNEGASLVDADTLRFGLLPSRLTAGVIAHNRGHADGLIRIGREPGFLMGGVTIADNVIDGGWLIHARRPLWLNDSILWQPGTPIRTGDAIAADRLVNLLVHDGATLGPGQNVRSGEDPRFVTSTGARAHQLAADSPAIDFGDSLDDAGTRRGSRTPVDADGALRDIDDPAVIGLGRRDAGAFERVDFDALFDDGFEG